MGALYVCILRFAIRVRDKTSMSQLTADMVGSFLIFSYDRSVVLEAVEAKRFDIIDLLMASGAYLVVQPKKLAG